MPRIYWLSGWSTRAGALVRAQHPLLRHARRTTTLHRHMRQQEAEQEAARRNAEDERRDRFLFYPLDHSVGMGDDAWEVEMRLRTADDGPVAAAVPVAAAPAEAADRGPAPLAQAD